MSIVSAVRRAVVVFVCAAATMGVGAGVAAAESLAPWWALTAGERPTDLHAGIAKDAVQKLTINGNGGEVAVINSAGELTFPFVAWDASAETVQHALEGVYPGDKVEVSLEPAPSGEGGTYTITYPGQSLCEGGVRARCIEPFTVNAEAPRLFGGHELSAPGECVAGKPNSCKGTVSLATLAGGAAAADGQIVVAAQNRGDASTRSGATIVDHLPANLKPVAIEATAGTPNSGTFPGPVRCTLSTLTCVFQEEESEGILYHGVLPPYQLIEVRISVEVLPGAHTGEQNTATVSGGGVSRSVTATHSIEVGAGESFGIEEWQFVPEGPGGAIDTQAGSHPFQVTSVVTFNSTTPHGREAEPWGVGQPKDVIADLPTGFVGNPTPFVQCTDAQFSKQPPGANIPTVNECPAASAVGAVTLTFSEPLNLHFTTETVPLFNMEPLVGEPARFGFKAHGIIPVFLDASVRTGGDYGVTITSSNITQIQSLLSVRLTIWGVPGDPRHDPERGWECMQNFGSCPTSTNPVPPPFLVMPSSCEQPFETTVRADSWGTPSVPSRQGAPVTYRLPEGLDGCNRLPFGPSFSLSPDVPNASTSTGLTVDVHVPQTAALNPEGLAESSVKGLTITLPQGLGLNPSGADGLQACPLLTGTSPGQEEQEAKGELDGIDLQSAQPANCPNASKIATVTVRTPLLPNPLTGFVYLATPAPNGEPGQNPYNSLIALYLVARDDVSGTLIKLPLRVTPNPLTGQLTAAQEVPELPFEDAELHFFGGERAPLGTPSHCGSYIAEGSFSPWSGSEPSNVLAGFPINQGANGTPCPGSSLAFGPSLTAGMTNINAGAFSPLVTTIGREDGQQDISSVQLHMPAGLSGILTGVKLCGEGEANAGTCTPESLIGETIVSVGLGNSPFSVTGGKVYLTGPYHGAPFGLSIVNPAVAGPFNLGKVIVRAKIQVDPHTAALTITTNSAQEGFAIPHILDGIPLQIKHVNVTITRPGFTFNPTNCNPQAITGTIGSAEGASSPVQVPFQVTNCATLKFAPKFAVKTSGKTSKANGASLAVKLTYPTAPFGSQANIARVKVDLPKQLPSRLTTLQKACTNAQFEANPAGCPSASFIGHAKATTPLLPVPLEGPAIFVSHGGEAFPSLIMVLQGYGVTLDLVGTTFISKQGITSSTFKTVPDAPVGSFELTLPQGKYSALAANGNLCTSNLAMPTEFLAQNGLKINESTSVGVTGCPKKKALTRAQKLAAALKACQKKANRAKRHACERAARKKYAPIKAKKKGKRK
jgi:hypothetical protein